MSYVTDDKLREKIKGYGLDPDKPGFADRLASAGIDIGPQPDSGALGMGEAAFLGLLHGGGDLIRGAGSLAVSPLTLLSKNPTLNYFGQAERSAVEKAHPYAAGIGGIVPTIAALATGGGAVEEGLSAIPKVGELLAAGAKADKAATGILGGFSAAGTASRAVTTAASLGALGALQPGSAEDRLRGAYEGLKSGAIFGALGAPEGLKGVGKFGREVLAGTATGALGQPPVKTPLPDVISGAIGGAVFGAFDLAKESYGTPEAAPKPTPRERITMPPATGATPRERPPLDPEVVAVRKKVEKQAVKDATAAATNPIANAQIALDALSKIPNPTPEQQNQIAALRGVLTTNAPVTTAAAPVESAPTPATTPVPTPTPTPTPVTPTAPEPTVTAPTPTTTTPEATPTSAGAAPATLTAPTGPTLPADLPKAAPRYSYGTRRFTTKFESDLDRAAYITAQQTPSRRDADYLTFVMKHTGMSEKQVRDYGVSVRAKLKSIASAAPPEQTHIDLPELTKADIIPVPKKTTKGTTAIPLAPPAATPVPDGRPTTFTPGEKWSNGKVEFTIAPDGSVVGSKGKKLGEGNVNDAWNAGFRPVPTPTPDVTPTPTSTAPAPVPPEPISPAKSDRGPIEYQLDWMKDQFTQAMGKKKGEAAYKMLVAGDTGGIRRNFTKSEQEFILKTIKAKNDITIPPAETAPTPTEPTPVAQNRPPRGEPDSSERIAYIKWENKQTVQEYEAKLAALSGRDEKTIDWSKEWGNDTRVRSLAQAKQEVEYFKTRAENYLRDHPDSTPTRSGPRPLTDINADLQRNWDTLRNPDASDEDFQSATTAIQQLDRELNDAYPAEAAQRREATRKQDTTPPTDASDTTGHIYRPDDEWANSRLSRLRSLLPGPLRRLVDRPIQRIMGGNPEIALGTISTAHPVELPRGEGKITLRDGTIIYNRSTGEWSLRQPTGSIPLTRADYTTIHRAITDNIGVAWASNILNRAGFKLGDNPAQHPIITQFLDLVHDSDEYKLWDQQLNGPTVPLSPPHFTFKRREYIDLLHAARFAEENGGSGFGGETPAEEASLRRAFSTLSRIYHSIEPTEGQPPPSDDEIIARAYYGEPLSSHVSKGTHTYRLTADIPEATARELLKFIRNSSAAGESVDASEMGTTDDALAAVSGLSQSDFERYIEKVDDATYNVKAGDPLENDIPVAEAALEQLKAIKGEPTQDDWRMLLQLARKFIPTSEDGGVPPETNASTLALRTSPPPIADALEAAKRRALAILIGSRPTERATFEDPLTGHLSLTTTLIADGIHPYVAGDASRFALLRDSGRKPLVPTSYAQRLADLDRIKRPAEKKPRPTVNKTEETTKTPKAPREPKPDLTTIKKLNTLNAQLKGKLAKFEAHLAAVRDLNERAPKMSPKERNRALAKLDETSTALKTTQAEMEALKSRITSLNSISDLTNARYRKALADENTARATLPDEVENETIKARRDIPLKTFEEALNRIGNASKGPNAMTAEHLASLPADLAARHTALRLTAKKMLTESNTPMGAKHSFFTLRRFARALVGKQDAELYPFSTAAGSVERPADVFPALVNASLDTDLKVERKRSIPETLIRKTGAKLGKGRDYYRLTDLTTGETHDYPTPETLAMGMDYLRGERNLAPDLTPTGLLFQLRLDGNGPRFTPSGGGNSDDLTNLPTTPLDPSKPTVNDMNYWVRHYGAIPSNAVKYIGRSFEAIFGHDFGIVETHRAISEAIDRANLATNERLTSLGKEFSTGGVFKRYRRGLRMDAAARQVNNTMWDMIKGGATWEDQQEAFAELAAKAADDHGLTDSEYKALFVTWKRHSDELFTEGGIDRVAKKIPFFYYPQNRQYSRGPTAYDPTPTNPLTRDAENPYFTKPRTKGQATEDPWITHIKNEFAIGNHGDFFRTIESYIHGVYNYKYTAKDINHLSDIIKFTSKDGIPIMPQQVGEFLTQQVRRFLNQPSDNEVAEVRGRSNRSLFIARHLNNIAKWMDKLDSHLVDRTGIPDMITEIAKKMGINAIRGDSLSFAKAWMQANRTAVFGANVMRAVRHLTATSILQISPRFRAVDSVPAWWDVIKNFKSLQERYTHQEALMRSDTEVHNVNVDPFAWAGIRRIQKILTAPYRFNDTLDRLFVIRTAERAAERGITRFKRAGETDAAWSDLIETTGLDTLATSPTELASLRGLASRDSHEFFRRVASLHQDNDVFTYARHNAAPFYDSTTGRLLGQYGSWPVNMLNSLYSLTRAPLDVHGATPRAARRYLEIGTRWAIGAELVYSVGAMLNIDTSDWIPFIHNLFFTGGPALTQYEDAKELLTDSTQAKMVTKEPGLAALRLARNIIPFPPNSVKDYYAQVAGKETIDFLRSKFGHSSQSWNYALGFPRPVDNDWDHLTAALGFKPYIYPGPIKQQNILGAVTSYPGRVAADALSHLSGNTLAPGSAQLSRQYRPLVGGPRR
jgi:hypothetical protein